MLSIKRLFFRDHLTNILNLLGSKRWRIREPFGIGEAFAKRRVEGWSRTFSM